jgi:hypothetical protein
MKTPRVYIDTSVIGGCFDQEFSRWSNGLLRDFELGLLRPVVSDVVSLELARAPAHVQARYGDLLSLEPEVAETSEEALRLAALYQERGILTPKYYDDGLHIALATVAVVDVLVSWNFKHIVHFDKIRLFNAVNIEQRHKPLTIHSPREVTQQE